MGRECDALAAGDLARVPHRRGLWGDHGLVLTIRAVLSPRVLVDGDRYAIVADRIAAGAIMDAERVRGMADLNRPLSRIASLCRLFHQIAGKNVLVLGDGPAAEPSERAGGRSAPVAW